jgi:hypothetical protein
MTKIQVFEVVTHERRVAHGIQGRHWVKSIQYNRREK